MSLSRYSYASPKIKSCIPLVSNSTMILHCHFSKTPEEIKMQKTPLTRSITICWQERPSQAPKTSMGQLSTRTTAAPAAKKPLLTILYWLFTLPEKQLRKGSNACPNHPDLRSHRQTQSNTTPLQFKSTFSTTPTVLLSAFEETLPHDATYSCLL